MRKEIFAQNRARHLPRFLVAILVGCALLDAAWRRSAPVEEGATSTVLPTIRLEASAGATPAASTGLATPSPPAAGGAVRSHGEDDDQPAGACWITKIGEAPPSCVCSAGVIETLVTPKYMRALLVTWRDAGSLGTRELRERLEEVDAACNPRKAAP